MAVTFTNQLNSWDINGTGYATSAELALDSQVASGFAQNDYLRSPIFNGIFREFSLISVSLIDALNGISTSATGTFTVNNATSTSDLASMIRNILEGLSVNYASQALSATTATTANNVAGGIAKNLLVQTGTGTTGFVTNGSNGQVLVYSANGPTWTNTSNLGKVNSATTADTATVATNIGNLKNEDTGNNTTVAFSIGTGANKKTYSKTLSFSGNIQSATNLAGGIPGNIPYQSGTNTTSFIGVADDNSLLGGGTTPSWQAKSAITVGNATNASKINNKTFDLSYNSSTHVLTITYHS